MKVKEPKPSRARKQAEKPVPFMVRLYIKQRAIVRRVSAKRKMSEASFIRDAIEAYAVNYPS
jgi:hypothetical protein